MLERLKNVPPEEGKRDGWIFKARGENGWGVEAGFRIWRNLRNRVNGANCWRLTRTVMRV